MIKWVLMIAMAMMSANAAAITIVKDGKSDYVIVLAETAPPASKRAASELQSYLKEMSGAELAIVTDAAPTPPRAIIVGPNRHVHVDQQLGNDGFLMRTDGERLVIAGPGPRGTMYGVSTSLEKLGVRWFTPKVTVVPKKSNIEIDMIDEKQTPAFEYREPYFTEAWNKDWAAKNKLIGSALPLDESVGGNIRYAHFVHSFDALVPPALFEKHPEYFPEIGGKRVNGYVQRCLTNPEVLKLAVEGVRAAFKNAPDARIMSVSQNDVDKWCQCAECNKIIAKHGGVQSGVYLWFVNQVAEQIEKELPDKLIDTLAYQFTEAAPTGISPRKNVRVRLCPIHVCQAHPYENDDFPASKAFMNNLAAWHKVSGDELYIWHYTTNFAHYLAPFPDFKEFPADARLYKRSGVKGVFFQGAYAGGGGGSDAELRSWVMSRVLWDVNVDTDKLVTEWIIGVYGEEAAKPMRKWFDLLHTQAAKPDYHFNCYQQPDAKMFPDALLDEGDQLFDQALAAAKTESQKEYVARNRLGLRYVKLVRHPRNDEVFKQFVADVRNSGISAISEGKNVDQWEKEYLAREIFKK